MIKTFKHKGLEKYFFRNERRLLNPRHISKIGRVLDVLDEVDRIEEANIPGFDLHRLAGDRKQTWSISVSGNWRITFRFESGQCYDVNLEDYH